MPDTDPSNWTDEQQREKCAEIVGWRYAVRASGYDGYYPPWHGPAGPTENTLHHEAQLPDPLHSYDDCFALLEKVCEKHRICAELNHSPSCDQDGCNLREMDGDELVVAFGDDDDLRRAVVTACLRVEQQKEAATT